MPWVDRLLDALLPEGCRLCQDSASGPICPRCEQLLPRLGPQCRHCALPLARDSACGRCLQQPSPLDQAWSGFAYAPPLDQPLHALKFHGQLGLAPVLGELLAALPPRLDLAGIDMLIPSPLHPQRLRSRGFNQALELCRPLARRHQLEIRRDILQRVHPTREQSRLNASQRHRNVRHAFACRQPLNGEHVLLFDDVMTTGATLFAMARTLKSAGAAKVSAITLARTL